ncbi:MAG: electron transport complex subunit E [Lachnospiraceae bacterium]|nr:electron transport complex subunit E [Lachnospiraceae bacterium]
MNNKRTNPYSERIFNGLIKENPCLILMLGMCPTLAVTTTASNGLGMGLSTLAVLILSNLIISLMRKVIPDAVRLPAYIVIVATLVTVVQLLIQAYIPALYASLGIYIPLIVVNCIILGRAEAYANKNTPVLALMDGLGMGLGFTAALVLIGILREFFGAGTFFGNELPLPIPPIGIFVKAPGAFLVMAFIVAVMNAVNIKTEANKKVEGCDGCCASCSSSSDCGTKKEDKE